MNTTIKNNRDYFEDMYDEVIIPAESEAAHYKAMITVRNRWMVDNSDFIITYIRREHDGAFTTFKYAQKNEISIIWIINITLLILAYSKKYYYESSLQ